MGERVGEIMCQLLYQGREWGREEGRLCVLFFSIVSTRILTLVAQQATCCSLV